MSQSGRQNSNIQRPPCCGFSGFCAAHAEQGDKFMYRVYVGGVYYSVLEYMELVFESSRGARTEFATISAFLFPVWNFVDAFGVFFDGGKEQSKGDYVWASINYFSGLQLAAATLVQIFCTFTQLPMAIGATTAALLSSGAFALCMFCSALVSTLKMASYQRELNAISKTDENVNRIIVLEAKRDYERQAALTWFTCGIAMTFMTLTAVCMPAGFLVVTAAVLIFSAYTRAKLREAELRTERTVADFSSAEPTKKSLHFDSNSQFITHPMPTFAEEHNQHVPAPSSLHPALV